MHVHRVKSYRDILKPKGRVNAIFESVSVVGRKVPVPSCAPIIALNDLAMGVG